MIRFITGVPGSGKTYYAVNHLHKAVTDPKHKDKYRVIYTNINQFDFSISDKIKPYNHEAIYARISRLHKHYKKKATDAKLIKMARRFGVYKALFVIDEAHNIFDVKNPVLVWWLSYHRHLYQDIDLITQNLSLIESKYKGFTEYFVRALPQSLRLFQKNFTYRLYIDSRMTQKGRAGTEKLKYDPEVFKLYHSGDKPKTKNIVKQYLIISSLFLIPLGLLYYYIQSNWSKSEDKKPQVEKRETVQRKIEAINTKRHETITVDDDDQFIDLTCIASTCSYQDMKMPMKVLKKLIETTESKLLYIDPNYAQNRYKVYLIATKKFRDLFKGVNHEADNHSAVADLFPDRR